MIELNIDKPEDAYHVAQQARHLAHDIGFSEFDIGMITIAVAEIATNVVRYALPGIAYIKTIENHQGIEVVIEDYGPGISNLEQAMVDGFSTYCEPSIGKGLGSAKRCVEEFVVNKTSEAGTMITLRHFLPIIEHKIDKMGMSFPTLGQHYNGDRYLIMSYQATKLLACVIDGVGKGVDASKAADCALEIVRANYNQDLDIIVKYCHEALKTHESKHPVQMGLLRILPKVIEFCGIGDIGIKIQAVKRNSFPVQDGSIGMILPKKIHVHTIERSADTTIFLHTDGVSLPENTRLNTDTGFERACCLLYEQTATPDDDATLIVIRDR
ncbi:ATP-binding protein [Vibrio palustris]|uniref:Serine/threonine-protein kinase RsbT n=1 Tax=Vibrio palustris TaxID=1918946 RepID=A0A1R4B290_9VIBR|nr:ATP-binding protein [Vibrio palustris]SJL83037.1 Serine/threonine-protein kinase RsbT [Vibrio palustris]